MTNGVSAEQAIINQVFSVLPDVKEKKEHVLKRGESLWSLAKKELGNDKKLSNNEIRNYMFLIAKINGLDTVEKMNGLHANQKIYLPGKIADAVKAQKTTENSTVVANNTPVTPKKIEKEKSSAEKTVDELLDRLKTDKSLYVQGAMFGAFSSNTYHVFRYRHDNNYISRQSPVIAFDVDSQGKVFRISLDDINDVLPLKYDYNIYSNGQINLRNYRETQVEKIDKQTTEKLFNEVQNLYNLYK